MPVVVDQDSETLALLLEAIPSGGHGIEFPDRLQAWLANRPEEYVVVLGPARRRRTTRSRSPTACA